MTLNDSSPQSLTYTTSMHFDRGQKGVLKLREGSAPAPLAIPAGRVPRIARLMALAIRFEGLLARGEVKDYADLSRLGHVSRARVSQIMNLLMLAPDLQEALLMLPLTTAGRDRLMEFHVRPIAAQPLWAKQRRLWKALLNQR
jgi:hypothetical protein